MRITRFRRLRAYTLVLLAAGIATGTISLVLAAIIPLVFVLQGAVAGAPPVDDSLQITREIAPKTPLPGQPVAVTLTIKNTSEQPIPDLRVIDGVPDAVGVSAGSPRGGGAVSPGGEFSNSYTLTADRGSYRFDAVTIRARNINGTRLVDETVRAGGDGTFDCRVTISDIPITQATRYTGQVATATGGAGIEFHSTRKHQPEDPVNRIDWRTYAKNGELATIEYARQHATHTTVLVDSREPAHVAADVNAPTGATLSAYAATTALEVLITNGHEVSLGALGISDPQTGEEPPAWVAAADGTAFTSHARTVCNAAATTATATDGVNTTTDTVEPATSSATTEQRTSIPDGGDQWRRVLSLVPTGAQVVLCTPATDDALIELVESLRERNHEVTILSPQTTGDTVGGRTVELQRAVRLEQFRSLGSTVVDWDQNERLRVALTKLLGEET